MFYLLVLVLLFAHTERVSVSSMQNALTVDFFLGGGVVILKNYLFLSSKVGTGRVSSRSKHRFLIFFFLAIFVGNA